MNILVDGQTLETPELNRGIGVYFKNILNGMVKQSYEHNWYVTVSDCNSLKSLDPWVQSRMKLLVDEKYRPGTDYLRTGEYTSELNSAIRENKIDAVWIPNPLMMNVLFPERKLECRTFITIYDLIPVIMPVKEWSREVNAEYARRLEYLMKQDVNCFFISEATKKDYEKHIGRCKGSSRVTSLAADSRLFYKRREEGGISPEPSIVFTGGFDYRKNIGGAVRAFAKMKKLNSDDVAAKESRLYIVCKCTDEIRSRFELELKELGLEGQVVLTGFVSDQELADIYAKADVFFFPSLYEGFGLPILEAMLGGAYVLSADNSSLPEVCGDYGLFCNAEDTDDMAEKLYHAINNAKKETPEDKRRRQEYAFGFSWEKTAMESLAAIEVKDKHLGKEQKRKIAIVTPWPDQQTGIANYVYKLVPYLSRYFEVDIFVDHTEDEKCLFKPNKYGNVYMIKELDNRHNEYAQIIYQIGNNCSFHTGIYNYLRKYPGIAEIHDFVLQFLYLSFFSTKQYDVFRDALESGYGEEGIAYFNGLKDGSIAPDDLRFPMSHSVSRIAKKTIVHNHWSREQMKDHDNVFTIPHPCYNKIEVDPAVGKSIMEGYLKKFKLQEGDILIGCFGFINENKRPDKIISALETLIAKGFKVKLVFFGKANSPELEEIIRQKKLEEIVGITGYIDYDQYSVGLEMCDIVVNLRYPSMGEASGTLCEAFKYGKPVLVSDVNQYREYPDEVCWKVPTDRYEIKVMEKMLEYLIQHEDVRIALGNNARAYADTVLSPARIAELYYNVINSAEEME